jgi:hypothetical protein
MRERTHICIDAQCGGEDHKPEMVTHHVNLEIGDSICFHKDHKANSGNGMRSVQEEISDNV